MPRNVYRNTAERKETARARQAHVTGTVAPAAMSAATASWQRGSRRMAALMMGPSPYAARPGYTLYRMRTWSRLRSAASQFWNRFCCRCARACTAGTCSALCGNAVNGTFLCASTWMMW